MVKLHGNFIVYDLAVPKQLKKKTKQNKGKLNTGTLGNCIANSLMTKKKLTGKTFDNG